MSRMIRTAVSVFSAMALAWSGQTLATGSVSVSASNSGTTATVSGSTSTSGWSAGTYSAYVNIYNSSGSLVSTGNSTFTVASSGGSMTLSTVDGVSYYSGMSVTNTSPQVCGTFSSPSDVMVAYIGILNSAGTLTRYNLLQTTSGSSSFCATQILDSGSSSVIAAYVSTSGQLVYSNTLTLNNQSTSVSSGSVRVQLTWDKANDMDLHLYTPSTSGATATRTSYGQHIYYGNRGSSSTVGQLDVDDVNGYGPENITVNSFTMTGRYLVTVRAYSLGSQGTTTATLNTYTGGGTVLDSQSASFTSSGQEYMFGYIDVSAGGSYTWTRVNSFAGSSGAMIPAPANYFAPPK